MGWSGVIPIRRMDGKADQHGDAVGIGGSNCRAVSIGSRSDKRLILDEFVAVTGYHRKHAIRVFRHRASKTLGNKRHSLRYGGDVREALMVLWEASGRLWSKRLRPLIPILLPALERHGRLERAPRQAADNEPGDDGSAFGGGPCCGSRRPAPPSRNEFGGSPIGAGAHLRGLE